MEEKDYKKLYEDVVALAKDGLKDGLYLSQSAKAVTEFLFPQLKETEDEKVKRELTRFLINFNNGYYSKPSENEIDSWIKWIDKKCEQNPTDEVKPKFKVGDWITNGKLLVGQVTSFDGEYYHYMQEGVEQPLHISNADNWHLWTIQDANDGDVLAAHECYVIFKEIDGLNIRCYCTYHYLNSESFYIDTLQNKTAFQPATKEQRDLLFQKMKEYGYEWDAEKKELNKIEQKSWSEEDEYQINTILHGLDLKRELYKKEGNQVEEKRYKTQYDWLKSIKDRVQPQQKQDWSKEEEERLNEIADYLKYRGYEDDSIWLKSFKDRVRPQLKQEWSKEDSERLLRIHQFIWANRKGDTDEIYQQEQDADWIMSIIPQQNQYDKGYNDGYSAAKYNQWKPTDKQMEDFRMLLDYNIGVFDYTKFMSVDSLYEDLKKNLIDE